MTVHTRESVLSLFAGYKPSSPPVFSGLIHVVAEGLERDGLSLHESHHDAGNMAKAAASTFKWTGMPSATLPLDLCLPAEMLGAELNFRRDEFPQVRKAIVDSTKDITAKLTEHTGIFELGRLKVVCDALGLMKRDIGTDVVISGLIPGPYTLLLYLCNPANLFTEMKKEPQVVMDVLLLLSSFLVEIGKAYREAGADLITIHDMGGSAGFIGPLRYEKFVFPSERELVARLPKPCVLSVCGDMNKSLHLLAQTGADVVSVDHLTDIKAARDEIKDVMLFGNIDPVEILLRGDAADITEAVIEAKEAGVDAIWPGCDLVPSTPIQNIKAMMYRL